MKLILFILYENRHNNKYHSVGKIRLAEAEILLFVHRKHEPDLFIFIISLSFFPEARAWVTFDCCYYKSGAFTIPSVKKSK